MLPALTSLLVVGCTGLSKESCVELNSVLVAAGREITIEHDDVVLTAT